MGCLLQNAAANQAGQGAGPAWVAEEYGRVGGNPTLLLSWDSWTTRKWAMASRSWGSRKRCRARCWARSTITWGVSSSGLAPVKKSIMLDPQLRPLVSTLAQTPPPASSSAPAPNLPLTPSSTC